jgi:hypothetical protein
VSQSDVYRKLFRDRIGIRTWIPAWRPGADLRLGMTGRVVNDEFVYEYDLSARGIDVPPPDDVAEQYDNYEGTTEAGVDISVKASGQTDAAFQSVAAADVGFKLAFKKTDAMAVVYRDIREHRITDQRALAERMVESWNGGPWPKMQLGDFAITAILVASYGFAFGSSRNDAEVVIRAGADLGAPGANLGSIKGDIGVAWQKGTSFAALSPNGVVIGFRGLQLRQKGLFFKRTVANPVFEAIEEPEKPVFAREEATAWPV